MRIGRRVVKVFIWGLLLVVSISAGGLWFAYWYMTDSETAAKLIREHAVRYFPTASLEPGRVRIRPFAGEVVVRDLKLRQSIDGSFLETLRIPWLHVRIDQQKLAKGHLEAREVVVVQPTLRLRRRRDGTWNLQGLLADPWPVPWIDTPPILIRDATLELIPEDELAAPAAAPAVSLASDTAAGVPVSPTAAASGGAGGRVCCLARGTREIPSRRRPRTCSAA